MVKPLHLLLATLLTLAGCGPATVYYRPGADVARLQTDTLSCQTQALKDAPVANQTRQSPPRYYPGSRYCNNAGRCHHYPGYWEPGRIYTVDVNQPLRSKLEQSCMAGKGYDQVEIKRCPQAMVDKAGSDFAGTLPQLTENSCVIENEAGGLKIIERK